MRVLNKKQKNMIKKWFNENTGRTGILYSSDQMPMELQEQIRVINDHETIWQNIDRYINDIACENTYKKKNSWE